MRDSLYPEQICHPRPPALDPHLDDILNLDTRPCTHYGSNVKRLLLLVAIVSLPAACIHRGHSARPLALGPADSGRTIDMAVGQVATVRLASNPGTGYRWQTTSDPDARVLIVMDAGYDRPSADAPGAPGQAWWKLRATGVGSTSLTLRYARPWEPDEKVQEFTLNVNVK